MRVNDELDPQFRDAIANLKPYDHTSGTAPAVPKEILPVVRQGLERALVERDVMCVYLQHLHSLNIHYPYTHGDLLDQERKDQVLEHGLGCMSPAELAKLALSPLQLMDLQDYLLECEVTEPWIPIFRQYNPTAAAIFDAFDEYSENLASVPEEKSRPQLERSLSELKHCDGPVVKRMWTKFSSWSIGLAAAVLILIGGAVLLLLWPRQPAEVLVADAGLQYPPPRGQDKAPEAIEPSDGAYRVDTRRTLEVILDSPRDGYVTIVVLSADKVECWPGPLEPPTAVRARERQSYGPLRLANRPTVMLVIFTERHAAGEIRKALPANAPPSQADAVRQQILNALGKSDQPWVAIAQLLIEPK